MSEGGSTGGREPVQWERERAYFDQMAEQAGDYDLGLIAERYGAAMAAPLYPLEVAYALMGNLMGKRVLDVGCGNGENSILFAHWGARVTGVDISAGAIAVANRRAKEAGVSERVKFLEMPFEQVAGQEEQFNVVWCVAFLHHVLDRLDDVVALLSENVRPDGCLIVYEPVRRSVFLKRVRAWIPPYPEGTPDERPLESADLEKLEKKFDIGVVRHFGPVSRIAHRFLLAGKYETKSRLRRSLSDGMYRIDQFLTNRTPFRRFAMTMVGSLKPKSVSPSVHGRLMAH